ncbi:MAG TPA: transporter substrate-binding domain-containing protein, partial [Candidatus Luteococcus avicola]|nr:transporter substrate-binding domain-containing protein [Candidatus Luteococcus avicola]
MYRRTTAWVRSLLGIVVIGLLAMIAPLAAPLAHADDAHPAQGKHYVIGTDTTFAPFEMRDPKTGQMVGIDMDLIRAIAEKQGFTIDIKSLGFDAAVQALKAGQVDAVMAGMSITDERKKTLDFTDGYFESGLQVAVAKGSSITSLDGLKGQRVAVKNGTAGADYAKSIAAQYGFSTVSFTDTSNMINDVKVGNSAAFIDDYPVVLYGIQQGSGMQVVGDKVKGNS